jgi:hypothetical protein
VTSLPIAALSDIRYSSAWSITFVNARHKSLSEYVSEYRLLKPFNTYFVPFAICAYSAISANLLCCAYKQLSSDYPKKGTNALS